MGTDDSNKKADDAKRLILARRARFVAAALASVAVTGSAVDCGGEKEPEPAVDAGNPQPCLKVYNPNTSSSSSGTPQPCLAPPEPTDAGPQPCLDVAYDAGPADAAPQPCLSPPKDP